MTLKEQLDAELQKLEAYSIMEAGAKAMFARLNEPKKYKPMIIVPDDFYDTCLMEADGKGTFTFFTDDLRVPITSVKKPNNWHDAWTFSDHDYFDIDTERYDADLDRLIMRGYQIEATEIKSIKFNKTD